MNPPTQPFSRYEYIVISQRMDAADPAVKMSLGSRRPAQNAQSTQSSSLSSTIKPRPRRRCRSVSNTTHSLRVRRTSCFEALRARHHARLVTADAVLDADSASEDLTGRTRNYSQELALLGEEIKSLLTIRRGQECDHCIRQEGATA
jgi:hypothetical protein